MILWESFYDYAASEVPGCPFPILDQALKQSAIAFCEQSLAWRYEHPAVAVVAATAEYAFVPPAEAVVHTIHFAAYEGKEISSHTGESDLRIWDWRNQTGTPEYVLGGATSLTLVPMPDVTGSLTMTVILKPSPTAIGVDDSMFNEFRTAIIHGALATLMLSPKKPYTNPQLGLIHQQQFTALTAGAGMRVARSYTRAPLQTSIMRRR